jgi:hypothetical protein
MAIPIHAILDEGRIKVWRELIVVSSDTMIVTLEHHD